MKHIAVGIIILATLGLSGCIEPLPGEEHMSKVAPILTKEIGDDYAETGLDGTKNYTISFVNSKLSDESEKKRKAKAKKLAKLTFENWPDDGSLKTVSVIYVIQTDSMVNMSDRFQFKREDFAEKK